MMMRMMMRMVRMMMVMMMRLRDLIEGRSSFMMSSE
jgi:hypothetical protein